MKRLSLLLILCAAAASVHARKYICSISGPYSPIITEYDSLEECRKFCDVCEETGSENPVVVDYD